MQLVSISGCFDGDIDQLNMLFSVVFGEGEISAAIATVMDSN